MLQYLFRVSCLVALVLVTAIAARANSLQVVVGEASANPGDTVEIEVRLQSNAPQPAVMVLFLAYNPAKLTPYEDFYEFVLRDLAGNPVRNDEGNAIVRRSAVRPEAALNTAEKVVDTAFHPAEGVIAISMAGLNNRQIGSGPLFTLAFQVDESAQSNERLIIRGVEEVDPVLLTDEFIVSFSTAAADEFNQAVTSITVNMSDGAVQMGCFPVASTPDGLVASQDRSDDVLLSWNSAANAAEYRVFRSETNDLSKAVALGSGWTTATSFTDVTALAPEIVSPAGCFRPANSAPVSYFYWVKARSAAGCESGFSAPPAEGFRDGAKAFTVSAASTSPDGRGAALVFLMLASALVLARVAVRRRPV